MNRIVPALIAIVAGVALAAGGAMAVVSLMGPDRNINFQNAPAANGSDGAAVDYGTSDN